MSLEQTHTHTHTEFAQNSTLNEEAANFINKYNNIQMSKSYIAEVGGMISSERAPHSLDRKTVDQNTSVTIYFNNSCEKKLQQHANIGFENFINSHQIPARSRIIFDWTDCVDYARY